MRRSLICSLIAAVVAALCVGLTTQAETAAPGRSTDQLDAYTATVSVADLPGLARQGLDLSDQRAVPGEGIKVSLVLDPTQARRLRDQGVQLSLTRVQGGQTLREFAAAEAANGFRVWRSYDERGGIEDQLRAAARNNPRVAKLVRLGTTRQGRPILALKLTKGARHIRDGRRPAVLYSATQHAREWIATEVDRRLMKWYIGRWQDHDKRITEAAEAHRAVVRAGGQPGRLRVHVRPRAAVAEEPARQRRQRTDHRR